MTRTLRHVLVAVAALAALAAAVAPGAGAARAQTGPSVTLDRTRVRAGEPVIVTLTGFTSQQATVAVCGNLAKRGSSDCNMPQSQSERIRPDEDVTLTQLFIQVPPVACPCIVRALGTNGEFAIAPIDLIDHPIKPLVSPDDGPLAEVAIDAARVPTNLSGSIRTGLAAATTFDVTVSVRNITTETLANVSLQAQVSHRLNDDAAPMQFDVPGPIEPGQTWSQTIQVKLPAPMMGRFTWTVVASGAGPVVAANHVTDAVPLLLYTLGVILALDIVVLMVRFVVRARRRRRRAAAARESTRGARVDVEQKAIDEREPVGVG